MKTTVIYHSADFDGIFCREIARRFLPDANLIGWNFGEPPVVTEADQIYVLDLPPECVNGVEDKLDRLCWIDHHKSSIEKWSEKSIKGYRIDGVAACRLAWQWFIRTDYFSVVLPLKSQYIDRKVTEPWAVRLAGEYDIWDKRDPDAEVFQYALRAEPLTPIGWAAMFDNESRFVNDLLVKGRVCQRYAQSVDTEVCKSRTWLMDWEGLRFLCVNTARFNSLFFAARDVRETGHDALLGFCFNGKVWTVSLYHAKHRTDLDLSAIAVKHGGGGHRGACGFTCKILPFVL